MVGAKMMATAVAVTLAGAAAAHGMKFQPGDRFTALDSIVQEFSPDGQFVASLTLPPNGCGVDAVGESRGVAFGPGGRLYVVRSNTVGSGGVGDPCVQVVDASGALVKSYSFSAWMGGLATSGDIRFSPDKSTFYVSTLNGVTRFDVDGAGGVPFSPAVTSSVDLAVMPNGHLLVSDGSNLVQYTADGVQVGAAVTTLADPYGLTSESPWNMLSNVRGVAYDPTTKTTFVTMLGYSGFSFQLIALDGTSNVMKGLTNYWYGSQMRLAEDGRLIVGSSAQPPGVFTYANSLPGVFTLEGQLGSIDTPFVTAWNKKH